MKTYYGTFAWNHQYASYYVRLIAESIKEANDLMNAHYERWSMIYEEDVFESEFYPNGQLILLNRT